MIIWLLVFAIMEKSRKVVITSMVIRITKVKYDPLAEVKINLTLAEHVRQLYKGQRIRTPISGSNFEYTLLTHLFPSSLIYQTGYSFCFKLIEQI